MSFGIYISGFLLMVIGLVYGAAMLHAPTHWIVMGTDTSLVVATQVAVRQMVTFLMETKGLTRTVAYQAASMAADLRITQLVDGNVGVHMMIAKSYLK